MATPMLCDYLRYILDFQAQIAGPLAEIDVFKPQRMKLCVKTAQPLPQIAPKHQERARRLIGFGGLVEIHVQASVTPVHGIPWEHAIDTQDFEHQCRRRWEAAQRETGLDLAARVHQPSSSRSHAFPAASLSDRIDGCDELGIRIEQQNQFRVEDFDALVHGCREAPVARVTDHPNRWAPADQISRGVTRSVVHHNNRKACAGIQAPSDDIRRVVSHDHHPSLIHARLT
jgi:hypothetical protein